MNEKASKTNGKQRENAFLANSDVSSLHRGIHKVYTEDILAVGPCRLGPTANLLSPSLRSLPPPLCRHCRATLSALPGTLIEGLTPSH